jgi:tetratricopeptide (TPR) repeat protein
MTLVGVWLLLGCNPSKSLENKGKICLELEDYARAKSFYHQGIEANPQSFESRYGYALSLSGLLSEKQKWAKTQAEEWLEVTNAYKTAYVLYEQLHQKEIEAASFKKYYRSSLYTLAKLLYQDQKYYSSLETLEELDRLKLSHAKSVHLQGTLYYQLGFEEEAEDLFYEAIERDSSYTNAYLSLGSLLMEQGFQEEAMNVLNRVQNMYPNNTSLYLRVQKILEME